MTFLKNKSVLVTGGTGSFGQAFVKTVLTRYPDIKKLIVFSRDEQKQFQMNQIFPESQYEAIRYFIGDVRDFDRLKRAMQEVDYVVHAAAMKHVHIAEYNPDECVKTNVRGAENVIQASLESKVSRVVALSTDKACAPINLYGATKLASDKLFLAANNIRGKTDIRFSVVRYGNVMGSNGSVIPFFLKQRQTGVLTVTHAEMTRFSITLEAGVDHVLRVLEDGFGGEIVVPKIPSYHIMDLVKAIAPTCQIKEIGVRPGEKIHEEMISESDSFYTADRGDHFVIYYPNTYHSLESFLKEKKGTQVTPSFRYHSGHNADRLSVDQLRQLIKAHIDPAFSVQ